MTESKSKEELAQARLDARAVKDFAKADQLRDEIAALGFEVIDIAGGFEFRAKERFPSYASTRDIKAIKVEGDIAITIIVDGFIADAIDAVRTIKANTKTPILALVIGDPAELVDEIDLQFQIIAITENFGWGENTNALLKNLSTKFLVIMDPSTRFLGDAMAPVLAELEKGEFSAVGWRGGLVNTDDEWRSVDDRGVGEVDVLSPGAEAGRQLGAQHGMYRLCLLRRGGAARTDGPHGLVGDHDARRQVLAHAVETRFELRLDDLER